MDDFRVNSDIRYNPPVYNKDLRDKDGELKDRFKEGTPEEIERARAEIDESIRNDSSLNELKIQANDDPRALGKLLSDKMVSENCEIPCELRQSYASSVAYVMVGQVASPLMIMQQLAQIQEELALSAKKTANQQMQEVVKLQETNRKAQLEAANREKTSAITKALSGTLISVGGVALGQAWTAKSNALKTKQIRTEIRSESMKKASKFEKDSETLQGLMKAEKSAANSTFGGALQQMTTSTAPAIGEAVTASSMQKVRQLQSNIDYQKTILDRMMKTVDQEEQMFNELRRKMAESIMSGVTLSGQSQQSVSFRM